MLASIGLIALGVVAGLVAYHFFVLSKHGGKSLAHQLDDLKKEHQQYQYDVSEHFQETTELLETLNQQYEKVQLHIQSGAEQLIKTEHVSLDQVGSEPDLIDTDNSELVKESEEIESSKPKDYA